MNRCRAGLRNLSRIRRRILRNARWRIRFGAASASPLNNQLSWIVGFTGCGKSPIGVLF
jgi:hypothetical protein